MLKSNFHLKGSECLGEQNLLWAVLMKVNVEQVAANSPYLKI